MFGTIKCRPVSVTQAIELVELDEQLVAVHGFLYYGRGCVGDTFICMQKEWPFDGAEIERVQPVDARKSIAIVEPGLKERFVKSISYVTGDYMYLYDAVIIGKLRHKKHSGFPVHLSELLLIILQGAYSYHEGLSTWHKLYMIGFDEKRFPAGGCTGIKLPGSIAPEIEIEPLP